MLFYPVDEREDRIYPRKDIAYIVRYADSGDDISGGEIDLRNTRIAAGDGEAEVAGRVLSGDGHALVGNGYLVVALGRGNLSGEGYLGALACFKNYRIGQGEVQRAVLRGYRGDSNLILFRQVFNYDGVAGEEAACESRQERGVRALEEDCYVARRSEALHELGILHMRISVLDVVCEQKLHEQGVGAGIPLRLTVVVAVDYPCALGHIAGREVNRSVGRDVVLARLDSLLVVGGESLAEGRADGAAGILHVDYAVAVVNGARGERHAGASLYRDADALLLLSIEGLGDVRHEAVSDFLDFFNELCILDGVEAQGLDIFVILRVAHLPECGDVYDARENHALETVVGDVVRAVGRDDVHDEREVGLGVQDSSENIEGGVEVQCKGLVSVEIGDKVASREKRSVEHRAVNVVVVRILIHISAQQQAALADAVYADLVVSGEGADLCEIIVELNRNIGVAESPVIEEVENMVVAYLVADDLHVEELGACVGDEVELVVLRERLKARVFSAAEYWHDVVIGSAVVVHSERLNDRSNDVAQRLFDAVRALLGEELDYARDEVGGIDSEELENLFGVGRENALQ